jgi:small conductance mechanosensitive channel
MQIPENLLPLLLGAVLRIGVAFVVFLVGRWFAAFARRKLQPILDKTKLTESMVNLSVTLSFYAIWVVTILVALAVLGFPVEVLLTFAGVTIVIIGIALQQSLKDFATAVIFVLFKPFEVGDLIQTKGITGTVQEMQFFSTVLLQGDNKVAILPNAEVQLNGIVNFTKMGTLRVDLVFGIGYNDDLRRARQIAEEVLAADPRVLSEPAPQIVVLELAESSVQLGVRPFVKASDYWSAQFGLRELIKRRFEEEGITIPFPQRDVHLIQPN